MSCHAVTPDCPSPLDRQAPLAAQALVTRICEGADGLGPDLLRDFCQAED